MTFVKRILPPLSLFLLGLLYYAASRWNLPKPEGPGVKEHAAFAFFLVGLGYLAYALLPKKLSSLAVAAFFTLIFLLLVGNWWYYDFYHTYLTLGALSLAKYTREVSFNFAAFPFTRDAILLGLGSVVFLGLNHILFSHKQRKLYLGLAAAFLALGIAKEAKVIGSYDGGYTSENKHPVLYLLREPFDSINKIAVDDSHYQAAAKVFHKSIAHGEYPFYQKTVFGAGKEQTSRQPYNVIVLVLESFRASELGAYNPGKLTTPNFDALSQSSTLYTRAYANSYQTSRGEMAILCSSMDYIAGAPFSESPAPTPTPCLPKILAENGYNTHWFHGYNTEFFNRKEFLPKVGFTRIHAKDEIAPHAKLPEIGWGVQDIDVFDYTLTTLEKEKGPFFAEIMSLSNHFPFTWDWNIPFPESLADDQSDSLYYNYQRGIHYTDYALGTFLERFNNSPLKDNTVLIVTADHGLWIFPKDQQPETTAEQLSRTDQYFRIPLLIKMPGQKKAVTDSRIASQLDIAPTVLDMLSLGYQSAFLGHSLREPLDRSGSMMFAGGHYHYREAGRMCYSLPRPGAFDCDANESVYNRCNSRKAGTASPACFTVEGDSLLGATLTVLDSDENAALLLTDLKKSVDFTQYALKHGLAPIQAQPTLLSSGDDLYAQRQPLPRNQ